MPYIRKYFSYKALLLVLLIVFIISRIYNILLLPIFTDESIYIYWAKYIETSHSHWLISLIDGKPPLLIWATAVFLTILPPSQYLLAGRLPSVIAGLLSVIAIYKLTMLFFQSKKISLLSSFLYSITPFILLYDRMALFDSLLMSMLLWATYFSLKTAKSFQIRHALLWGFFLGLGFLSKPTAEIFLILTPAIVFIYTPSQTLRKKWRHLAGLAFIAVLIGDVINNLQRLSHVYFMADLKNQQFQEPVPQLLAHPFMLTYSNLHAFFMWLIPYYTIPLFAIGICAFLFLFIKRVRIALILFILWLIPIFTLATVGKEIFPRYILFTTPYFLIPISFLFVELLRKNLIRIGAIILFLGMIFLPLRFDYFLLFNPPLAPMPETDYTQYISLHPSGYGLDAIFEFLHKDLKKHQITLVTQGTFGLYPYAFTLEFWGDSKINIVPRWPLDTLDQQIYDSRKNSTVYVLLKEDKEIPKNLPLRLVVKGEKPGGNYPILLTTFQ